MRYKKPSDQKEYQYLNIPKKMDECYFDLEFVSCKETDKGDKLAVVFTVLDTDTTIEVGSEVSLLLDPNQAHAERYFWDDVFGVTLALKGKVKTPKRLDKLKARYEEVADNLQAVNDDGEYRFAGKRCTVRYDRFIATKGPKKGQPKTAHEWEPYAPPEED